MGRRKKGISNPLDKDHQARVSGVAVPSESGASGSAAGRVVDEDPYTIPFHSRQAAFAILWLFVYSFAMFTLPFGAFYGTRHVLAEHFQIEGFHNTCGSVLAAVMTVNVIIMLYAFRGFRELEEEDRERSKRKSD
uniref:Vacuolar ATPase assembly integral membrane protein VMA21 homolog n=1 Tax=Anopheles minimus TaxID=112268 RepID=A0A182WQR9_9DIPT